MDHALSMSGPHACTDTSHQSHATLDREVIFIAQQFAQRRPSHKLHYDVSRSVNVVSLTEVVNGDDVRMTQHCRSAGFSSKSCEGRVVCDELACQDLHRDVVTDVHAPGAIDHTHAAFAELGHEF